ncbi:MAG: hypothetical protein Q4D79_03830 [Propionibacteriaceae bacterium]|nr:hypothetical protein [Propionibacteriaceae bacterium]
METARPAQRALSSGLLAKAIIILIGLVMGSILGVFPSQLHVVLTGALLVLTLVVSTFWSQRLRRPSRVYVATIVLLCSVSFLAPAALLGTLTPTLVLLAIVLPVVFAALPPGKVT